MRTGALIVLAATAAHADPLPDRPAFCELTPCLQGTAHRRMLAKDETVGGARCKHGDEVGSDDAGHLMYCTLAGAQALDGLPAAGDAYTLFHPNGRVYQTHLAKPYDATMPDKSTTSCEAALIARYDDGQLYWCQLRVSRDGGRTGAGIMFNPGGKLAAISVIATQRFGALQVPAGTSIHWDTSGAPVGGDLAQPVTTRGISISGEFSLHPNGEVHQVELAAEATVAGHKFPAGAELTLRDDGTLEGARWLSAMGTMIHGELWEDTTTASYDPSGKQTSSSTSRYQATEAPHPPKH